MKVNGSYLQSRLSYLYCRVLTRTVPHTLVSWRFLLPRQSFSIQLHRQVFLQSWSIVPKFFWLPITLYSLIVWYSFFSWYYSLRCWWANKKNTVTGKSSLIQLFDLLRLSILHGIPPRFYYHYKLYNYRTTSWFDFIYTHELPHWHCNLSLNNSTESNRLLSDKHRFSKCLAAANLQGIPTLFFLNQNTVLSNIELFQNKSLFLKPNEGNGAKGCMLLRYSSSKDNYALIDFLSGKSLAKECIAIALAIEEKLKSQAFIVQENLQNHPSLQEHLDTDLLVTIRLITGRKNHEFSAVMAVIEIPLNNIEEGYLILPIDCSNGLLRPLKQKERESLLPEAIRLSEKLMDFTLPYWKETCTLCCNAHEQFYDITTIGWDIAISKNGPVLIEGNVNWGVAIHQIHGPQPALQGPLAQLYKSN